MVSKPYRLSQIAKEQPIAVASFDLFDTLITRRIASQESLYRSLGRRLVQKNLVSLSSEQFAYERSKAVPRLKRLKGTGDPTIEEIYREMSLLRAWPEDLQQTLVAEEM